MIKLEQFEYINNLLNIYGELLTKSQKSILNDYYRLNLSISEIAINHKISRAAVNDTLKKGKNKLLLYEDTLCNYKFRQQIIEEINKIKASSNDTTNKKLDSLERKIKHGI